MPVRASNIAVTALAIAVVSVGVWTLASAQTTNSRPLRHEPIPSSRDGLMAGHSDDPVLLFEEGMTPDGLPSGIMRDGTRLEAPSSDVDGTGDDLLYRTTPGAGAPAPGTVHNVEREVRPDRETGREPWLTYHAVFDPAVIPFKRNSAKDAVAADGALVVGAPALVEIAVAGNRTEPGREVFWGSILVELEPGLPIPVPSVSPDSRILSYETVPQVSLRLFRDGGDNFFVEAEHKGRVRVNFVMDAPGHWFHHRPSDRLSLDDVPASIRPTLPEGFVDHAHTVARKLGITSDMGYAEVLRTLVFWFRSFAPGELPAGSGDTYLDLALGRKGVCRHRAYAFVITAHGLGIPARYVSNEAHVFVEVFVPRTGWMRIDLGGGASGMNVRNSNQKTRHQVAGNDPFGFPPGFRDGYSQGALQGRPEDAATGDPVRGLPPIPGHPGAGTGAGGAAATGAATGPFSRFFGTPKVIPFAESRGQKDTRTTLEAVSARVFRGDKLSVQGVVVTEGGNPVVGGRVRINLVDPGRDAIVRVLGNTRTDEAGTFAASVTVPTEVELGTWEVIAEFVGNAQLAPSRSE